MTIRRAKTLCGILAALAVGCFIASFFCRWLFIGAAVLLTAAQIVDFRFIRCPHCGRKLLRRSYLVDPTGICPHCGRPVDENTIIE